MEINYDKWLQETADKDLKERYRKDHVLNNQLYIDTPTYEKWLEKKGYIAMGDI